MMPDGSYRRAPGASDPASPGAQGALMARYAARGSRSEEDLQWT